MYGAEAFDGPYWLAFWDEAKLYLCLGHRQPFLALGRAGSLQRTLLLQHQVGLMLLHVLLKQLRPGLIGLDHVVVELTEEVAVSSVPSCPPCSKANYLLPI